MRILEVTQDRKTVESSKVPNCRGNRPLQLWLQPIGNTRTGLENLYDSIPHGVPGKICDRMQVEFAHEVGAVRFSRLDAQI